MPLFCRIHRATVPGLLLQQCKPPGGAPPKAPAILVLNLFLFPRFYPNPDTTAVPLDLMFAASATDAFDALES